MTNNKQQTAVDIIYQGMSDKIVMQDLNKALICIHISHDDFLKLHKQAKEMNKEQMDKVAEDWWNEGARSAYDGKRKYESFEQYYQQTYGGGEQ